MVVRDPGAVHGAVSGEGVSVNAMPWARVRGWLGAALGPVAGVALTCALCATAQAGGCEALVAGDSEYHDPAAKPRNPGNDADGTAAAGVRRFTELLGRPFSAEFKTDAVGWTDMHYAALLDLPEVVAALCDAGMAADVRLKTGYPPFGDDLKRALAALGHEEFKHWKVDGETPLMVASMGNARNAAAALAACGADVDAIDRSEKSYDRKTPLHYAASRNSLDVARLLVELGADMDAEARYGRTPLHKAAGDNSLDVAKLLVERGADVDARTDSGCRPGWSPLHYAASRNSLDVAKLLVEHGVYVDAKDRYGETPLHDAARDNSLDVAKLLVERGAHVNAKDRDGETPLHKAAGDNSLDVAKLLVEHGADVDAKDTSDRTPLHAAAGDNSLDVAKLLVERGADVDAKDTSGRTPLHDAAGNNSFDVAKMLVERGADVDAKDSDGRTPLHYAAGNNPYDPFEYISLGVVKLRVAKLRVAKLLVERGADVNAKDAYGRTPLNAATAAVERVPARTSSDEVKAAWYNLLDMAKLLVERGADVNAKDAYGRTLLDIAIYELDIAGRVSRRDGWSREMQAALRLLGGKCAERC